jgi:hypothetical protein
MLRGVIALLVEGDRTKIIDTRFVDRKGVHGEQGQLKSKIRRYLQSFLEGDIAINDHPLRLNIDIPNQSTMPILSWYRDVLY